MNRITMWIVAVLVLLALVAGKEVSGYDSEAEITENAGISLSSDPEWSYEARKNGTIVILDY